MHYRHFTSNIPNPQQSQLMIPSGLAPIYGSTLLTCEILMILHTFYVCSCCFSFMITPPCCGMSAEFVQMRIAYLSNQWLSWITRIRILEAVILPALWVYQAKLWFCALVNSSIAVMSVAVTLTVTLSRTSSNSVYYVVLVK